MKVSQKDFSSPCGCEIHIIKWSSKADVASVKYCPVHKNAAEFISMLKVAASGFSPDPGTSDLDDEQPIYLSIKLGDYRKIVRLIHDAGERNAS